MLIMFFLFFVFIVLFQLVHASKINNQISFRYSLELPTSIKYQERIGTCFGSSQLSSLSSYINKASTYYRTDYQQNIKYIKENMDQRFGSKNTSYTVIILTNQTKSGGYQQYFYNIQACNYALLAKGINKINQNWAYLVYKVEITPTKIWNYVHNIGKGEGITSDLYSTIQNILISSEGKEAKCNCPSLNINLALQKVTNESWNIICLATIDIYGSILVKNDQWLIVHPKLCYYLIYTKQ